jgi:hypothetical protein
MRKTALLALLAGLLAASTPFAGTFDESRIAASFLKVGTGARASAMGEAFSAVADDSSAMFWNPAGLSMVRKTEFQVSHNQWISDVKMDHFMLAIPAGGTWGLAWSTLDLGEFSEWDGPGNLTGRTFSVNDQVLSFGYGNSFYSETLQVGAAGKYIKENLGGGVGGQTYTMDLGVTLNPWVLLPGTSFAVVVQNLGGELSGFELPMGVRFGAATRKAGLFRQSFAPSDDTAGEDSRRTVYPWEASNGEGGDMLVSSFEVLVPQTGRSEFHWGVEYWLNFVALRAGYRYRFPRNDLGGMSGLTLGLGIRGRSLQFDYGFDYAYAPYGDLGDASRFSVLVAF